MESGHFVAYENVHFSRGNYETKSSKLAVENAKCSAEFEGTTVTYGCSKIVRIASKLEDYTAHTDSTLSTGRENIRTSFQLITRMVSIVNIEVYLAEMTEDP